MNDPVPEKPSLESLDKRLDALKKVQASKEVKLAPQSDGARIAIDFASASAVGIILGFAIDHYAGSSPWGILIGLFTGVATGVYLMFKAEAQSAKVAKKKEEK